MSFGACRAVLDPLIGGALGVALLTALLVGDLNAGALLLPGHDVLGPNPGIALLHLDQQESVNRDGTKVAVVRGFNDVNIPVLTSIEKELTLPARWPSLPSPIRS